MKKRYAVPGLLLYWVILSIPFIGPFVLGFSFFRFHLSLFSLFCYSLCIVSGLMNIFWFVVSGTCWLLAAVKRWKTTQNT